MKTPLFSIIIPTYNSSSVIKTSLQSILCQTLDDFEVLIIDGLSSDNTLEIVKSFADNRIKVYSEKDKGVYDAMNKGIKIAQGEWLYFLGSDDQLYDTNVLNDVVSQLTEQPSCDLLYGNAFFLKSKIIWYGYFNISRLLLERNICHQSIFYRTTLFKKLGHFNLNYKICADWDFNIRCFMHTDILIIYFERIIANYNDASGVSAGVDDPDFFSLIPVRYLRQLEILKTEMNLIKHSKEFKLGSFLLKPFRFVKSILRVFL